MRRFLLATMLAATLAAAAAPAQAATDCLAPHSWIAGSVALCQGALVYGDYVDDDYGADTGQRTTSHTASLAPTSGDQSYPAGQEATADLVRLTLKVEGDKLHVTGLLNALYKPDSTILAVAVDSDNNPATGGGKWGALDVSSKGWDQIAYFKTGDPATNTIEGTMPLPPGGSWRVQAVTAQSDGTVMNVAFRGVDETANFKGNDAASNVDPDAGSWFEDKQAKALGSGDISEFGQQVDVSDLKNGVTRAAPDVTGLHERVYTSDYTLPPGEGRNEAGVPGRGNGNSPGGTSVGFEQTFQYLGKYQPYGIYIPKGRAPYGMQMLFHGSSSVMSGLVNQPGMQQRFGEELHRILVVPEGRGQNGFGSDISERDLLDVMADVQRTYKVDRTRVYAGGYSQGGYATYRMASLHPDRFAGAIDWVGFTGDGANGSPTGEPSYTAGAIGNGIDFIKNLLNVPTVMLYAGGDELVHVWTGEAMDAAFAATDNLYRFYMHPTAEHLTFATTDDWRKEAEYTKDLRLVRNPPRVVFTTAPFLDAPQFGIRHDRAYWVSRVRTSGEETDYGTVDLTNAGCGGKLPVLESTSGAGDDPVPWTLDEQRAASESELPAVPKLTGTLTGIASLRIDARRACLTGKTVEYDIETDRPVDLTLSDGRKMRLTSGRARGRIDR